MPHLITVNESHYTLLRDLTGLVEQHLASLGAEVARLRVENTRLKVQVEDLEDKVEELTRAKEP